MASPAGLQLFLGRRLPDEVLQRIFEFGLHLWLAKPYDVWTRWERQQVLHLVRVEDVRPDVSFTVIYYQWDEELDVERRVEKRLAWPQYYKEEYLLQHPEWHCGCGIIGLARPIVRALRMADQYQRFQNGEGGYYDISFGRDPCLENWHFIPVHYLPWEQPREQPKRRRRRREPSPSPSPSDSYW